MRTILFIFVYLFGINSIAQEDIFMQNGYMGYTQITPNFRKNMEALDDWKGVEFTFKDLAFSLHSGSLRSNLVDSTYGSPSGKIFNIGYRAGYDFSIGESSFFSASVKPFCAIGRGTGYGFQ